MATGRIALGSLKSQKLVLASSWRRIPANTGNRIAVLQRIDLSKNELTQLTGLLLKENK